MILKQRHISISQEINGIAHEPVSDQNITSLVKSYQKDLKTNLI